MAQERAVLAGGCFWGMQDLIRKLPGVVATRVGYTGGDVPNATYRNHGTHAEGIEIPYPKRDIHIIQKSTLSAHAKRPAVPRHGSAINR
jgi:peptide methionine sulfoxide reductase MsrA